MTNNRNQKREMMIAFAKLGEMLCSGIPFLQAVKTVGDECQDADVVKAFATIHDRVGRKDDVRNVLAEFGGVFPKSVQLMWQVGLIGNAAGKDHLPECCRRAAAMLDVELRHK